MLRVGINALLLSTAGSYRGAGVSNYTSSLLEHVPNASGLAVTAFVNDKNFKPSTQLTIRHPRVDTTNPLARIVWEQFALPGAARAAQCEVLHGAVYASPLAAPCATIVTVHDLTFVHHPTALKRFNRVYLRLVTRLSCQQAERVITVSESTRRELIVWLGLPANRVVAVANGVGERFQPAESRVVDEFRQRKNLPAQFLLFVGTLEPRKNVTRLIEAYARCRAKNSKTPPLVIAGSKGWLYDEIFARASALDVQNHIIWAGFVSQDELPLWYAAATIFVYPSLYEGFGLPVLEAMSTGTAVITSNTSSLPEVAGNAALLVDPTDVEALAEAMARLLNDDALRAELSAAGLKQAAKFSWQRCAEETVAVYREALGLTSPQDVNKSS